MNELEIIFAIAFTSIMFADIALILTGHRSISVSVWLAEAAHPTLLIGVFIAGGILFYFCLADPWVAFVVAVATGHLVTSEGAAVAVASAARWTRSPLNFRRMLPTRVPDGPSPVSEPTQPPFLKWPGSGS